MIIQATNMSTITLTMYYSYWHAYSGNVNYLVYIVIQYIL